ncbi:small ribosomal subunit protein uS10m-like [Rhopilema esculentum]|uniref:small ribosomal subunit protein uS10m-like n=1 Tax=Rhopilema esculentum TaxID=499914 RepID=UPI0031D87341
MFSLLRICKYLPKFTPLYGQRVQALAAAAAKKNTVPDANETEAQPRYFRGKKIEEEVQNPFLHEYLLLIATGYDAAILDSYSNFVQIAAKMVDMDVTKSFNLPAIPEVMNVKKAKSQLRKDQILYKLKRHQRFLQVIDVSEDKIDIFVDYIQENLPCGVQLKLELKRWEEHVAPNHPSLQTLEKSVSRYQKS